MAIYICKSYFTMLCRKNGMPIREINPGDLIEVNPQIPPPREYRLQDAFIKRRFTVRGKDGVEVWTDSMPAHDIYAFFNHVKRFV